MSDRESEADEHELSLDEHGRTAISGTCDYRPRVWDGVVAEAAVPGLVADCKAAYLKVTTQTAMTGITYSTNATYWVGADTTPRTALERFANVQLQTGSVLEYQFQLDYIPRVFMHTIPRFVGGPDLEHRPRWLLLVCRGSPPRCGFASFRHVPSRMPSDRLRSHPTPIGAHRRSAPSKTSRSAESPRQCRSR